MIGEYALKTSRLFFIGVSPTKIIISEKILILLSNTSNVLVIFSIKTFIDIYLGKLHLLISSLCNIIW